MKKMIFLLAFLPLAAFAQRFELAVQGGVSGNMLPHSVRLSRERLSEQQLFRVAGFNPVVQVSTYCYVQPRFKIGATLRFFSTSGAVLDDSVSGGYRSGKFSNTVLQLLAECAYRFVQGEKFTFDAGVQGGPAFHTINNASTINRWQDSPGSHHQSGFAFGLNFTGRYMVAQRVSVNCTVSPLYNLLSSPDNLTPQYGGSKNYSTLCLPLTVGLGIML